jgi:hypothetical protein
MTTTRFTFSRMLELLRKPVTDGELVNFFGRAAMARITRDEYYGSLEFKSEGIEVVFKKAPWVVRATEITDSELLYASAFHLHRRGHDGYAEYRGELPNSVAFNDAEVSLIRKLGMPALTGGGGTSKVLKRPIRRWLRYLMDGACLQFELDASDKMQLATLFAPDVI